MAVPVHSIGDLSSKCAGGTGGRRHRQNLYQLTGGFMLNWAVAFFVIALIAAIFGFFGIASAAVGIAKILFFVFLVLFLVSLVGGLMRRA
jgi:uncharacterized membrane protein YtjA (UPF0391 family)